MSFDLQLGVPPGLLLCQVQNLLAKALNNSLLTTTRIIGGNRIYRLPNASDIVESHFELNYEVELRQYFNATAFIQVPSDNFLGGHPVIRAVDGQGAYDCCD